MKATFDYRKLVDDFVLGDRRLGETAGIQVEMFFGTSEEVSRHQELFIMRAPFRTHGTLIGVSFTTETGAGSISFSATSVLSDEERKHLGLLASLIRYFG